VANRVDHCPSPAAGHDLHHLDLAPMAPTPIPPTACELCSDSRTRHLQLVAALEAVRKHENLRGLCCAGGLALTAMIAWHGRAFPTPGITKYCPASPSNRPWQPALVGKKGTRTRRRCTRRRGSPTGRMPTPCCNKFKNRLNSGNPGDQGHDL